MGVALYTILEAVNHSPTKQLFHPLFAFIYCACVLLMGIFAPNLAFIFAVLFIAISFTYFLIGSQQSKKAFLIIVALCVTYSFLRLVLIAITTNSMTSKVTIPTFTFPAWLGSIQLGGPVDLDALYSSAKSVSVLAIIVIACCAFSFLVGPQRLIHLIPTKMHTLKETTQIASNVLWRTPNEVRLISEAQSHLPHNSKFLNLRWIFPTFVSELVNQSATHAGVIDLRKNAIEKNSKWFRFSFSKSDAQLATATISFVLIYCGIAMAVI